MNDRVIIQLHDASLINRIKRGDNVEWCDPSDEEDCGNSVMRVVSRGATILVLRPLRFYERWLYLGRAHRVFASVRRDWMAG